MKAGLYIIATPIGNLKDITQRAIETLEHANIIACEDTRQAKKLFSLLGISNKKTFINVADYNEVQVSQKIVDLIKKENVIALISDAGSPLISDPGYKLVKFCKENDIYITTIPGPCAAICAMQLSALPTDRFLFAGFVPNKEKARADFFEELKTIKATIVCYETANRIIKTLEAIKNVFAHPQVCVAREITKLYEQAITDSPQNLITHFQENEPKGEMVVLIYQKQVHAIIDIESILTEELQTKSLKQAVADVVKKHKLNKNDVYKKALELKQ